MHRRLSLIILPILASAALAAVPARAESRFSTSRFEITFADGWLEQPSLVAGDSGVSLMYGYSMMGFCYLTASLADHPLTAQDSEALRKQVGGADSVIEVAEGSDTLGGKTFSYAEYQNADTSNGDIRLRLYSTSSGTLRFNSILTYDHANGAILVAEMDSALATLAFPTAPIRPWAPRSASAQRAADHDVLGRSLPLTLQAAWASRTPLFRPPER